ncbi:hypothetical protein JTE90_024024 [Oedothorax gibbosus]|uniref:Nephrin n=1 Tax=Oedothorax gibbosus TaxID=931172 RepID=A0AAV6VDE6_9ARAC|nr:hypothetical protein JTE90_024024 [Oedothorax gibbosus]
MEGFDAQIPGFPRYSIIGNSSIGIFDLQILNASLEDEADFECQVGPAVGQDSIQAKAHLSVLLPHTSIRIIDQSNGSVVQIKMSETLRLQCEVTGGKPAPKVTWMRNFFKLSQDDSVESVKNSDDGRQVALSVLSIRPNSDDNNAYYSCEAESSISSIKMSAGVTLDVLYAPGRPSIEGYRPREKIRAGDTVRLRCVSRGGNPLARLVWTRNGQFKDHSYVTSDSEAENELTFVANASDDGAVYTCTATSVMTPEAMVKSIKLKVLYAPKSVTVKAQKEAKLGDVISSTCTTEKSNPAAEITWIVDGIPVIGENKVEAIENGGWITISTINVNVTEQDRNVKLFTCYAVNQELGETVPQSASVNILYAPDPPNIFGYNEGTEIHAGKLQRLTCISHGGHPLPELKWYKGDTEVTASEQTTSGNIVSRELSIIAEASDNGAKYSCKSSSKALSEPLVAETTLTVYFPPTRLKLKVEKPKKPKAGSKTQISCESTNSNPPANITWWKGKKNDLQLKPASINVSPSSVNGGYITKATYVFNATAEDDKSMFTCQASNEAIQQSVHDTIIVDVFYKPIFPEVKSDAYQFKENDSSIINMTAKANPDKVTYVWKKQGKIIEEGSFLNFTSVVRSQTGEYTCHASNDIGESVVTVILKVFYPAMIAKSLEEADEKVIIAEPESNVRLHCNADGYPMTTDTIKWKMDNENVKERSEILSSTNGKSILSIRNVSEDVSGTYTCVANNGIGSADSWKMVLLIKHRPVIKSTENNTVMSDRKMSAQLYCTAEGIPEVTFTWTFEGVVVYNNNPRVRNETAKLDHVTYQDVLVIDDVRAKDFGDYICVARNELGFETIQVALLPDGAPDPPHIVRVLNTTRDSLLVTWVPGFSGGHNQTHRIRFKSVLDPAYSYVDVHPPSTNSVWISGLKPRLEYEVAMKSINVRGSSDYTTAIVKAVTLDSHSKTRDKRKGSSLSDSLVDVVISTVATVFFLILAFNIVLLALYYRKKDRRRRRKHSDGNISNSSDEGSSSSKPGSDETTFSSYTENSLDKKSSKVESSESVSAGYSENESEESYSSTEERTYSRSSESSVSLSKYKSKRAAASFI